MAAAGASGFHLPSELLPNEPTAAGGYYAEGNDDDFFDPEIAEAIAAAEAADLEEHPAAAADDESDDNDGQKAPRETGDLEDDFVALACAPDDGGRGSFGGRPGVGAAASKRGIFNRFFNEADNEDGEGDGDGSCAEDDGDDPAPAAASVTTSRRGRPLTYHEEVIEDQFDRLLLEFQRDADGGDRADDEDPGAVDDDCGSVMTKSLYQVLERHDRELASQAVTLETLDEGRLPASDTLRILAAKNADADEDDDDEDDASSLDTDEELSLWGPMAAPSLKPRAPTAAAMTSLQTLSGTAGSASQRKNMPALLEVGERVAAHCRPASLSLHFTPTDTCSC